MRIVSLSCSILAVTTAITVVSGCQPVGDLNGPTPPDLAAVTDFVRVDVAPGSNGVGAFTIPKTEYTRVTLVGITGADPQRPLDVPMGMRFGFFGETGCTGQQDSQVKPAFVAQQGVLLGAGTYCLEAYDLGNLTETVNVMMRVVHPAPTVSSRPGRTVGGSNVTVGGSASRTFDVSVPGTAEITLSDLQPNVPTGLGIGFQQTDGTGCRLTRSIVTTARSDPPHFSLEFDPGSYCAQVFDIGNYTRTSSYVFTIFHP
jgi:hypothetical protein